MPQTLAPVDTSVPLPPSVARAAAAAEALHKATYGGAEVPTPPAPDGTPPAPPVAPAPLPADAPAPPPPAAPTPPAPVADPPAVAPPPPPSPEPTMTVEQALDRARSMEGRFKQSQRTIEAMQTQMAELGDELVRAQHARQPPQPPQPLVTQQDVETFGPDILDMVQRVARATLNPDLEAVRNENRQVQQRVVRTNQLTMHDALSRAVPNWTEINASDAFKNWVSLRDVYSGQVREKLLKAAWHAGDVPRVIAFFEGYARDVAPPSALVPPAPPSPVPPQRQPVLSLDALTAPGRPHPATGDTRPAAETPVITHAQIRQFYDNVRRGHYAGRDDDKRRDENLIFAAQREGRVKG